MRPPPRVCIFCGKKPLSREDVWPIWFRTKYPSDIQKHGVSHLHVNDDKSVSVRNKAVGGEPRSRKARCVCVACNNGWMSVIQNRAKPLVEALSEGRETTLNREQQKTLASWCTMSTITSEYFNFDSVTVSFTHRMHFYLFKSPPADWKIWIGDFERNDWKPARAHNAWPLDEMASEPRFPDTQTTSIIFGRLYVHTFSSSVPNVVPIVDLAEPQRALLHQIWPIVADELTWPPPRRIIDRDADNIAADIFLQINDDLDRSFFLERRKRAPDNGA